MKLTQEHYDAIKSWFGSHPKDMLEDNLSRNIQHLDHLYTRTGRKAYFIREGSREKYRNVKRKTAQAYFERNITIIPDFDGRKRKFDELCRTCDNKKGQTCRLDTIARKNLVYKRSKFI
ncbi:MAG: hypothetical protein UT63_C0076G0008 [Candidatus Gottesmanbacteria bacterium GW2011_GWC2_39_8]|uniref:Uncharacterized protein n=1 Tax=Candidatus Gottesmanbacteria bacterium GW2011_GWC2_39_8 TaxID=1618450 RepID=A0A0G0T0D0_9BACT|nr:MAG: hypothetical protein UT63_C0076G0008 [Candidatus Gottesmanbacteria bacterium GW2011_GWC2_39_8]